MTMVSLKKFWISALVTGVGTLGLLWPAGAQQPVTTAAQTTASSGPDTAVAGKPGKKESGAKNRDKKKDSDEEKDNSDENPTILLEGFSAQITRDGVPMQEISAEWALMDEKEQILDLRNMRSLVYSNGEKAGEAQAGTGRVWLKDRKKEQISRHDVIFGDGVRYVMKEGWILQTPRMHYSGSTSLLTSDAGYIKQLPVKTGYMIGRGQQFEIKLDTEKKTFETWNEHGRPAVLLKSEKPELKP